MPPNAAADPDKGKKLKELTNQQRERLIGHLINRMEGEQLARGAIKEAAEKFHVGRHTVQRIWKKYVNLQDCENFTLSMIHKETPMRARKPIYNIHELKTSLQEVPILNQITQRDAAAALKISTTTFRRAMADGSIRSHSNAIKPTLTEENELHRYLFCRDEIKENGMFKDMYDRIHLDGK